jgi:F0F1-type ATP synthase assembly protein I
VTDDPDKPQGQLRPVSTAGVVGLALLGLLVGWLAHPVLQRWFGVAPVVTWLPSLLFGFVAAILFVAVRGTRKAQQGTRPRPDPQHMVNRFVLARSTALVGSLVAGTYAGYAISWLGLDAELASQRVVRSAVAALAAAVMVLAAVLLERACRVRSDDEEP